MTSFAGATVRGHVTATDPAALQRNIQMTLAPRDAIARPFLQAGTALRRPSNEFVFQHVRPGAYTIEINAFDEVRSYYARLPINVGAESPDPVEVQLAPVLPIRGVIAFEGEAKVPHESLRVSMNSLDGPNMPRQPNAAVQKDGTFVLENATPGRWRLFVGGASGFIKSISLNERAVAGYTIDVPAGGANVSVVFSTASIEIDGALAASAPEGAQVSGMLWPADEDRRQHGLERSFQFDPQGRFHLAGAAPGRYYACAVETTDTWRLLQNTGLLNAIESRCQAFDLVEGRAATVQIPLIANAELERMTEESDK